MPDYTVIAARRIARRLKRKLTPPIPGHLPPTEEGVYLVKFRELWVFCAYRGGTWGSGAGSPDEAASQWPGGPLIPRHYLGLTAP